MMATATLTVSLSPEIGACVSVLADLAQRSLQVRDALVGRLESSAQPGSLDLDLLVAARASDGLVVLEPSELLLELVRAARAGELDGGAA